MSCVFVHRRLLLTPERLSLIESTRLPVLIGKSIHAAKGTDMSVPDGSVQLEAFDTASTAVNLVEQLYRRMAEHNSALTQNVSAADLKRIPAGHDDGRVRAITVKGENVDLLAIVPSAVEWIEDVEVNEAVIATHRIGNGYAAAAQAV